MPPPYRSECGCSPLTPQHLSGPARYELYVTSNADHPAELVVEETPEVTTYRIDADPTCPWTLYISRRGRDGA